MRSRIEMYLRQMGMTQSELARRVGISKQKMNAIVQGQRPPELLLIGIARQLGVTAEDLLEPTSPVETAVQRHQALEADDPRLFRNGSAWRELAGDRALLKCLHVTTAELDALGNVRTDCGGPRACLEMVEFLFVLRRWRQGADDGEAGAKSERR